MTHRPGSKSVLLLDISRLMWRARRRGPTGIDRVELAYAQHFISAPGERPAYAVLHLLGFVLALSPASGRRFVADVAQRWQGSAAATRRANLAAVIKLYWRLLCSVWLPGPWLRRKLNANPGTPIFLVVSHHHLTRRHAIARIRSSLNTRTACLIHDLLPIDFPEYFKPGWEQRYHRLAGNVGQLFDAVIANSESTARSLQTSLKQDRDPAASAATIRISAPGVRILQRSPKARAEPVRPFFAILGTIEPRKNHLLLLNLWTRLASSVAVPPRLRVIGSRGWENEQVVDMLERSRRLRGLVEEHNGVSDADVADLLWDARALLQPSFAEGFGLPLAEALTSGIPVICSDIPPFREVGRDVPDYLDPLDLNAWRDAVVHYTQEDSPRRAAQLQRLKGWRAPCWSDHFSAVEHLLGELEASRRPAALPVGIALEPS